MSNSLDRYEAPACSPGNPVTGRWIGSLTEIRMIRLSVFALVATVAIWANPAALAKSKASPRGTNSSGPAQPSGTPNREPGLTSGTALGTGKAKPPPMPSGDSAIKQENAILDRKLKSICRGC
jgi:hypothetical protein